VSTSVILSVRIDGIALSDDEARAFWDRFSLYMDEHPRDLAGFAKSEGLASVEPQMGGSGGAVLVGSKSAPQRPYANATAQASSGSPGHQRAAKKGPRGGKSPRK
jgi:hypothetical protein